MRNVLNSIVPLALTLSVALFACKKNEGDRASATKRAGETTAKTPAKSKSHAPAGARPGTHEDWCGEHQVPESLCTRCNPSLISAFKATGDWCNKHGLPESQCLICNPDLKIKRPPKTGETNR